MVLLEPVHSFLYPITLSADRIPKTQVSIRLKALDSSCGTTRYLAWGVGRESTSSKLLNPVTTLISAIATPETVIEGFWHHRLAHFVCHGLLEIGKPFDASLELHKANLTLLAIVRSQLPAAEFVFLATCHTAELTEDSVADEGLHLTVAMQHYGFRSVVGTM